MLENIGIWPITTNLVSRALACPVPLTVKAKAPGMTSDNREVKLDVYGKRQK